MLLILTGEYQKENSERAGWGTKRERYGRERERERQGWERDDGERTTRLINRRKNIVSL